MGIGFYLQDTRQLIRDQNGLWISDAQLTRFVNEARRQVAQRTGCIRRLIMGQSAFGASAQPGNNIIGGLQPGALPGSAPNASLLATTNTFQAIPGVERYPYQGFANPYLQQQYAGCDAIIDVANVSISWQGSFRPTLVWMPWDDMQAYMRAYANLVTSYPYVWSVMNDGEFGDVWLFPVPSGTMEMEWDVYAQPSDLNSDDDFDAIPGGWRNAVKFGAAELAFMSSQRYAQAQVMGGMFDQRVGNARVAADRGKTPNYYATVL